MNRTAITTRTHRLWIGIGYALLLGALLAFSPLLQAAEAG